MTAPKRDSDYSASIIVALVVGGAIWWLSSNGGGGVPEPPQTVPSASAPIAETNASSNLAATGGHGLYSFGDDSLDYLDAYEDDAREEYVPEPSYESSDPMPSVDHLNEMAVAEFAAYQDLAAADYADYLDDLAYAAVEGQDSSVAAGCPPGGCTSYPTWCDHVIKGNVAFESGERIYHVPGQEYYDETSIDTAFGERWFCTEQEAQDAGWRKAYK